MRKGYYAETKEDALVMWAEDVATDDYLRLLDGIEAGISGATVTEELPR